VEPTLWSATEMSIGVVCVSLPSMAYLFRKVLGKLPSAKTTHQSYGNSTPGARASRFGPRSGEVDGFALIPDHAASSTQDDRSLHAVSSWSNTKSESQYPLHDIRVQNDVYIDRS
jgi:hypothetical protein